MKSRIINGWQRLWSIVLAGGEGERMRPMVKRWLGQHRPKQYCTFVGTRSMFQHTFDRAAQLTPPSRIVTVSAAHHQADVLSQLEKRDGGTVLMQPRNCDTAPGIYLPLSFIRAQDPRATVLVHPSDHFVHPEPRFLEAAQRAVRAAEQLSDRLVLLAAVPDHAEPEYGWIEPGPPLAWVSGYPVRTVRRFLEKPPVEQAERIFAAGALWSTLVLAAKVETLWTIGWHCLPEMMPLFEQLQAAWGTADECRVLERSYRQMPARNFSLGLLEQLPDRVAVIEMDGVVWSDWGKPERIAETLQRIERPPAFPLTLCGSGTSSEEGDS